MSEQLQEGKYSMVFLTAAFASIRETRYVFGGRWEADMYAGLIVDDAHEISEGSRELEDDYSGNTRPEENSESGNQSSRKEVSPKFPNSRLNSFFQLELPVLAISSTLTKDHIIDIQTHLRAYQFYTPQHGNRQTKCAPLG
jgi:hypothetical protein